MLAIPEFPATTPCCNTRLTIAIVAIIAHSKRVKGGKISVTRVHLKRGKMKETTEGFDPVKAAEVANWKRNEALAAISNFALH